MDEKTFKTGVHPDGKRVEHGGQRENQSTITAWADATFGPAPSIIRIATRANEEMAELLRAAVDPVSHDKVMEEAADVVIILNRLATVCGFDLNKAVDEKMKINRARLWRKDGTGHGYHVRDKA